VSAHPPHSGRIPEAQPEGATVPEGDKGLQIRHLVAISSAVEALPARGAATIYDVARRAGVSIATVSRTLRDSGPVSARTRSRVEQAIEELGFQPSYLGVSLAAHRHAANGIVFPDLSGPFYAEVVLGYEERASRLGRSVLILSSRGRTDVAAMVRDLASRVDGLVLLGADVPDRVVAQVQRTGPPMVLLARAGVGSADTITTDNAGGGRALAEHLLAHGHTRMRFLGDARHSPDVAARWEAVSRAWVDAGLRRRAPVLCPLDEPSGHAAALEVLTTRPRPHVLVAGNDEVALGALLAAEELGLSVPGDVAVTGWDDVMAARYSRPGLTTVRQPMRELGERAAQALDELTSGARTTPRHQVLPTQLVVRASCGPHEEEPA
jgi:DNA-binding LacI/PurR family transcriptional regulator